MKKTLAVALAAALTLLLSGCFRMHVNLTLEENDKASGSVVFAVSDEAASQLQMEPKQMFEALLEQSGGADAMAPEGSTQKDYAQDGYTGLEWTFASQPISEASGTGDLDIKRDGDDYVVTGKLDMGDQTDETSAQLMESSDIAVNITFPGEVKEANGEINGNTVTWKASATGTTDISARGSAVANSGGISWPLIIGIIVGVLIIAAIVAVILKSRNPRRKDGATADGPTYVVPGEYPNTGGTGTGAAGVGGVALPVDAPINSAQTGVAPLPHAATGEVIPNDAAPSTPALEPQAPTQAEPLAQSDQSRYAPTEPSSTPEQPTQPAQSSAINQPQTVAGEPTVQADPAPETEYPLPPADPENPENPQQ